MIRILSIAIVAFWLASCSQKSNSITTGSTGLVDYRTQDAAHAMLGSYGRKTKTVGFFNVKFGYQRVDVPKWKNVELKQVAVIDITEEKKRQLEKAGVKLSPALSVEGAAGFTNSSSYRIVYWEVLSLAALRDELREMMKNSPDTFEDLKDKDARIVITTGVVLDHETARQVTASLDAKATLANVSGSPEISLKGNASTNKTLKIGNKTVVEYQYAWLCWRKGQLRSIVRDSKGAELSPCPSGSKRSYPG